MKIHLCLPLLGALLLNPVSGLASGGTASLAEDSLLRSTYLIELRQGSPLSQLARGLRHGGFELAGGRYVAYRDWYSTNWSDVSVAWMTQVSDSVGVIFGGSTGERGKKYSIEPSLKLGVLLQTRTRGQAIVSLRATTVVGGRFKEKGCTADYGEIGGVQTVNCRLAASTLPPSATLRHLIDTVPQDRYQIAVSIRRPF